MTFTAPVEEFRFILENVADFERVAETQRFSEASPDMVAAVLGEAGRMCNDALAPLQRAGDIHPAVLENGVVRTTPGYAQAYTHIAEGGWVGIAAAPEFGGMGLPMAVASAVNDMMTSACMALHLNPLLSQGQIEALEKHGSDALKARFLPKLISGEWNGTMNLTEPHAGSDVGALSTQAVPNGDGTYAISGQKIFISWGESDFNANTCHMVLARLPDGAPGTKGISLFLIPRFLPTDDGSIGAANSLHVASLEHKMGLHGSPTAVMQFEGATGWLVGDEHDGMAAMFTMMNNARLGVGVQGVGAAEAAYQRALAYAKERKQGRTRGPTGAIIDHADVRRMLLAMKADIFAARSIAVANAVAIDMATATGSPDWIARAGLLTPICKAFGTDVGIEVASLGVQVHGGMGYIEETGAAQIARDVRVTAIYEGTNGIQAMDLVGRKMADQGEAAFRLLDEIESHAEAVRTLLPDCAEQVWSAAETLREAVETLLKHDPAGRFGAAVPFLTGFARVLGGHFHLKAAAAEGGQGPRTALARFYVNRLLPQHSALLGQATIGDADLYTLSDDDLSA